MKKIYFLFLLALLPLAAYADAVEIDGIYYDLNAENNTAEVKSNPNKYSGSVVIPSKVTYENNTYDVTSIGDIAFYECTELISISIPNGITSIGFNAFYRCYKLSSINIPNTVTKIWAEAFWWCGELTSVTIPNGITTIEPDVFRDSGLNSIEIPSSVTYISSDAFNDSFLTSVTIPNSVTGIGEKAFYRCNKMEDIYSYIQEPFAVNENVFPTNDGKTILHVPAGTKSAYLNTTGWSKFGESNIVEFTINGSGQVDGIYYQFSESEASVKSNPQKYTGSVTIPSSVKYQGKTYNVTSISNNAFESCSGLTSVVIPNSVTSIGKEAFEGCSSLAEINIPDGVTSIAHQTFKNCNSLTAIVIPENVTGIAYEAFKGCSELTAITIPNSVRGIGNEAFEGCSSLAEINIPTGITSIGDQTFHDCSSLTTITIPDGVTSIGEDAFKGCLSITSITIPKSVATIKTSAFNQCPGLISLNVESDNAKYDSRGNCNAIINTETNSLLFGTKNTIIPNDVTSIASFAFYGCTTLTSITIPSNITSIGNNAFQNCTGLVSITIPSSVTSISANEFYGCSGLTSVTIPSSVTSIGSNAFEDCSALKSVVVNVASPLTIGSSVFTHRANATLYVPAGAKAAYEAADYWKEFKEIIETGAQSGNIVFANDKVKAACVAKWDTNKDGELSYEEAAAVTSLVDKNDADDPFAQLWELWTENSEFSFDEFQYFTGVTSLAGHEFECNNLTSIILPNSITSIGDGTFVLCKKLTSIHIPASVTYIHMGNDELPAPAFNPKYLQTITVDPENTKYASPTGSNVIIDTEKDSLILGCGNTDFTKITNTVTKIGWNAFESVTFTNPIVSLPTSVTKIARDAFRGSNITSINLGELSNLTTIGTQAFSYCTGLTEVTLPASIRPWRLNENEEGIGTSVFANCYNIVKVVSNIEEPFNNDNHSHSLYYYIFAIENDAVLYVPEGKVQAYIDKGWKEIDGDVQSFRVITDGEYTPPVAREGLVYGDYDIWMDPNKEGQRLIYPGAYRDGMMEYSLDGSTYSTSVPTGKEAGEYTVYYRKVGLSDASILKVTIAAPKTISVFSGSNLWAGYVAAENLALPTGLKAYVITSLDATTATASPLDYIPQGVPVLLKRENTSDNNFEMSAGSGTAPTVNLLETYESAKNVSNREGFILYNDEFVLVNEGTLPAGRVFLPANKSGVALTRGIVTEGDDTTGIYNSKMDFDDSDKQWYDLQGRKLERKPTKKGIYILDGRKVVIK